MRVARRLLLAGICLAVFGALTSIARIASVSCQTKRLRLMRLTMLLSRTLLRVLDIRVKIVNQSGLTFSGRDRCLFVANHMSYLDVACMMAVAPAIFVTSREIEEKPFLGHVTRAAGCLFVERRYKTAVLRDIEQLSGVLNEGYNIGLFPEGSTSDGAQFLPWKRTLMEAAMRSRSKVIPMCLRYETIDGQPFGPSNRDSVAWYGDMTFFPHLMAVLRTGYIDATLTVLPPLTFRDHKCRKRLTEDARQAVEALYFR